MPAEAAPGVAVEQLQLTDAAATAAWLARLPLKNAAQCHALLAAQAQLLTGLDQGDHLPQPRLRAFSPHRQGLPAALLDSGSNFERATYIAG